MATEESPLAISRGCFLASSEAMTEGHPDKLADQVAEAILDACIEQDPDTKSAIEVVTKAGMVMTLGEITTTAKVEYDTVVRDVVKHIGYDAADKGLDYMTMEVVNKIDQREPGADVVDGSDDDEVMFGYATNETPELVPLSHKLALQLCCQLSRQRKTGLLPWARPDGKAQVSVEYWKGQDGGLVAQRVHSVVVSVQHAPDTALDRIREDVWNLVVKPTIPSNLMDAKTVMHINPAGRFVIGGPHGDAGLTGRQSAADAFSGWSCPSSVSLIGKDVSKVGRCGSYAARWVAKSLVKAGLAQRCSVQLAYTTGIAKPSSICVDSHGSARPGLTDMDLCDIVRKNFELETDAIVRDLKLKTMRYLRFATYGHYGREDLMPSWEQCKDLSQ